MSADEPGAMKRRVFMGWMASCCGVIAAAPCVAAGLNHDHWIPLDAEALAETGIRSAYQGLLPVLKKHIRSPAPITEQIDSGALATAWSARE
jgi:hypothetical protein